jgi:hypothetical protein
MHVIFKKSTDKGDTNRQGGHTQPTTAPMTNEGALAVSYSQQIPIPEGKKIYLDDSIRTE